MIYFCYKKNSRTESELSSMKKMGRNQRHRGKSLAYQRKSSVYNDLSYYYSLTDVKSYEDEEEDEEKHISSSSLSSSSPSSSVSSSRRTYSSQSLDDDFEMLPEPIRSKSSTSLNSDKSSAEKSDRVCEMPGLYRNANHKSLSDYCMSDILKQKRRRRLIRYFKGKRGEFLEKWRGSVRSLTELSDLADESDESGAPIRPRQQQHRSNKCNKCESNTYLKDDEEELYRANSITANNSSIETFSSANPESQIDTENSSSPAKSNPINEEIKELLSKQEINLSPIENSVANNEMANLNTVGVDETSTTNTDVSDPHWDGYTVYFYFES